MRIRRLAAVDPAMSSGLTRYDVGWLMTGRLLSTIDLGKDFFCILVWHFCAVIFSPFLLSAFGIRFREFFNPTGTEMFRWSPGVRRKMISG